MALAPVLIGFALIGALCSGVAFAADCRQALAIYRDANDAYELDFAPGESDAQAASHRFTLKVLNTKIVLDGYVMGSEPVDRTNGMMFFNCPEGDVTGDDLKACTVWQGVIYGLVAGHIDLLPSAEAKAADEILLPDFGPSIRNSKIWGIGKATVTPGDVLALKGCST